MSLPELMRTRRSVRSYQQRPVEEEKLEQVLEAARLAPSAANRQPWRYIIVDDHETKERLRAAYDKEWFTQAPLIVVACGVPDEAWKKRRIFPPQTEEYWKVDVAISLQNLIMAAWEQGLGSCWIAAFDENKTKSVLGIPKNVRVLAMTPLGYPQDSQEPITDRKPLNEIAFKNKWETPYT